MAILEIQSQNALSQAGKQPKADFGLHSFSKNRGARFDVLD